MSFLTEEEQRILADVRAFTFPAHEILKELREIRRENAMYYEALKKELDAVLVALQNQNIPVAFNVTETALGEKHMADKVKKASVDLQILDDGKGVLFTLQPVNAAGNPVPLPAGSGVQATSSAPASLTVAPDPGDPTANPPRPADTTGLVFLGTVPKPPVDATGVVVTFSDTLTGGQTISTAAAPVDITADNTAVGFTITETAE